MKFALKFVLTDFGARNYQKISEFFKENSFKTQVEIEMHTLLNSRELKKKIVPNSF